MGKNRFNGVLITSTENWKPCGSVWFDTRLFGTNSCTTLLLHVSCEVTVVANGFAILRKLVRASTGFDILATRVIVHVVALVAVAAIVLAVVTVALAILRVAFGAAVAVVAVVAVAVVAAIITVAVGTIVAWSNC